jgi:hypothetical protein
MGRLAGAPVSFLNRDQRDLTLAFLGALGQPDAALPCHAPPKTTLDQRFAAQEPDRG